MNVYNINMNKYQVHSFLKQIMNNIFNSHFKGPAEFGLLVLGGDQVVGHDELLEVKEAVTVGVQGPEHVITEAHRGDPRRKEGGKLRPTGCPKKV